MNYVKYSVYLGECGLHRLLAGSNTFIVASVSRNRRQKGDPVLGGTTGPVSNETATSGYGSRATGPKIDCSANYRPVLSSQSAPHFIIKNFMTKEEISGRGHQKRAQHKDRLTD
jgi:hypothetical protein